MSFLPLTVKNLSCFFNSIPTFNDPWRRGPLRIFLEKEKMLHFLLFPIMFVPFLKQNSNFESHLFCRLHELWIWTTNIEKHESIDCIAIFNMISVIWRWPVHLSMLSICSFNPLPDDNILGLPKLKVFADDKFSFTQNIKVIFHRIENIVGKGYHHFLLFPHCFQEAFSFSVSKVIIVWQRVNPFPHNDAFWRPWETSLLKTQWEKEKLLITSNFSFSHSVFYPFW